jgi:hypothetical protein
VTAISFYERLLDFDAIAKAAKNPHQLARDESKGNATTNARCSPDVKMPPAASPPLCIIRAHRSTKWVAKALKRKDKKRELKFQTPDDL